jgi:hypothetical protein
MPTRMRSIMINGCRPVLGGVDIDRRLQGEPFGGTGAAAKPQIRAHL